MNATELITLSMQRAMLGVITPNMRAVAVEQTAAGYVVWFYYVGEPSEGEAEAASVMVTESGADFPEKEVEWELVVPGSEIVPRHSSTLVYWRAEEGVPATSPMAEPIQVEYARYRAEIQRLLLGRVTSNLQFVATNMEGGILLVIAGYLGLPAEPDRLAIRELKEQLCKLYPDLRMEVEIREFQAGKRGEFLMGTWLVFERAPTGP